MVVRDLFSVLQVLGVRPDFELDLATQPIIQIIDHWFFPGLLTVGILIFETGLKFGLKFKKKIHDHRQSNERVLALLITS